MKEFMFVVRTLVLTLAIVFVMQYKYEGVSLEARATHFFSSSQPIHWLQENSKDIPARLSTVFERAKEMAREYLNKN